MTCEARLLTQDELNEAMEPLSADAETLVAGHIEALTAEAAKVPGLEAWREEMLHTLARGLDYEPKAEEAATRLSGIITEAEVAEQRIVDVESERDAARQEVDEMDSARAQQAERALRAEESAKFNEARAAERNHFAARLNTAEHERDDARGAMRLAAEERDRLAERVATLEREVRAQDEERLSIECDMTTAGVSVDDGLRDAMESLVRARDTAEARVKELEGLLATARTTALEEAAKMAQSEFDHGDESDRVRDVFANVVSAIRALKSQPAPAPAQGVEWLTNTRTGKVHAIVGRQALCGLLVWDNEVWQPPLASEKRCSRCESRAPAPTPPALVEAVGETAVLKAAAEGDLPAQSTLHPSDMSNTEMWRGAAYSIQAQLTQARATLKRAELWCGCGCGNRVLDVDDPRAYHCRVAERHRAATRMRERVLHAFGDLGFDLSPRQTAILNAIVPDDGAAPATPESELRAYPSLVDAVRRALGHLRDGHTDRVGDAIAELSQALGGEPRG
ncbi:hypothetical protein [Myxococcus eversor]|uniref:hypothetical protein n=1 Tax=Myxococcus eversor TaxID=2709661 RepID=UPI0013D059BA|nr:hypothetical protein [Myxococcus eversor]